MRRLRLFGMGLLLLAACDVEPGPRVGPPARQQIRPTDGTGWNNNGYGSVTVEHHDPPAGRFRVHYTLEGIHAVPTFLARHHGTDLLPAVFEELSEKGTRTSDLDAIDRVLIRDHASSLTEAFAEFALWNLFTGKRAAGFSGYADAASYPEVAVDARSGALPLRISDEIAYLSARYYRVTVASGQRLRVTSERPQPKLALHLVTWPAGKAPLVVSAGPDDAAPEIASAGEVIIVAASTARADRHLPLSLAVTAVAAPADPVEPPPDGSEETGCSVTPRPSTGAELLLPLLPLLLLIRSASFVSRLRRRGLLLLLLLLPLACSDDNNPTPDLGLDTLALDSLAQPDAPAPLAVGQFADFEASPGGRIAGSVPTASADDRYILLLQSRDTSALKEHDYTVAQTSATSMPITGGAWAGDAGWRRRCTFHQQLRQLLASHPRRLVGPKAYLAATQPPVKGDPRYNFRPTVVDPVTGRQRGCNLFAAFHGQALLGPATQPVASADGKLRAGGAELLTLKGQSAISFTVNAPAAARAWARLIRIK